MSCSARLAVVSSVFCSCLARNLPRRDTTFVGSKQPSSEWHIAIADRCRLVKTSSFDRNFAQASNRKLAPTAQRSVCIVASVFVSAITARCRLVKTSLFDRNFAQTLTDKQKLAPSTARRSVSSHVSSLVYWNETLHCLLVSCLPQNRIFLRQWQQSDDCSTTAATLFNGTSLDRKCVRPILRVGNIRRQSQEGDIPLPIFRHVYRHPASGGRMI